MCQYPGRILVSFVAINWLLMAWCIRLSEARENLRHGMLLEDCQHDFRETIWIVPITFMTIGYGDVVPKSSYGRMFALWTGVSGIVASAVLVGLTTDKLTMTRRERMINRVLYNESLRVGFWWVVLCFMSIFMMKNHSPPLKTTPPPRQRPQKQSRHRHPTHLPPPPRRLQHHAKLRRMPQNPNLQIRRQKTAPRRQRNLKRRHNFRFR